MSASEAIHDVLRMFQSGDELSSSLAQPFLDALISEEDEPRLAQVFNVWHEKGVTENEIYYVAKIMRARCTRVSSKHETFVEEALVTQVAVRNRELLLKWNMNLDALLDVAIRHEMGHALCNDPSERSADRVADMLEQGKTIQCSTGSK